MTGEGSTVGLGGVTAALVTPLDDNGRLDHASLDRLLERLGAHGLRGISPAGSTGEGTLLSRRTRVELVIEVRKATDAATAVVPGVVATSLDDVREDLDAYAGAGADAALVPPPYYYRHDASDVERFYDAVLGFSPLPIVFYNIPQLTKVQVPVSVVRRLAGEAGVAGIKDSSGELEYHSAVLAAMPEGAQFATLTGTDTLLVASLTLGGAGTIAASVNLVPELSVRIAADMAGGELERALVAQRRLLQVVTAVRRAGTPGGWKAALSLAGVCEAHRAPPGAPIPGTVLDQLGRDLAELGVL